MYPNYQPSELGHRPGALDMWAGGLLLATVVLRVVALVPPYFGGSDRQSLWSQPDQAVLYLVLLGGWALALAFGVSGPLRARLGAALAVGLAVTEFGFRLSDLGEVFRYGTGQAAAGLWLMTAAWLLGAAGAVVAVLAVRHRSRWDGARTEPASWPVSGTGYTVAVAPSTPRSASLPWSAGTEMGVAATEVGSPAGLGSGADSGLAAIWGPTAETGEGGESDRADRASGTPSPTVAGSSEASFPTLGPEPAGSAEVGGAADAVAANAGLTLGPSPIPGSLVPRDRESGTAVVPVQAALSVASQSIGISVDATGSPQAAPDPRPLGVAGSIAVILLALLTAGAFLPAWDHFVGVSTTTGRSVSFSLGNAFSGPWQVVIGNVFAALALAVLPVVAIRLRDRTFGAALVAGSLIVLGAQFTAAIVQADHAVPPSVAGLSPAQSSQLGLQLHMSLTGWFTVDVVAAYALFAVTMIIGYLHEVKAPPVPARAWPGEVEAPYPGSLPW